MHKSFCSMSLHDYNSISPLTIMAVTQEMVTPLLKYTDFPCHCETLICEQMNPKLTLSFGGCH